MALKTSPSKKHQDIAALLERSMQQEAAISFQDGMIKVVVSPEVFQHRFNEVLHHIKRAIDEQSRVRAIDVAVLVRDRGSRFEHAFKIWRTHER